MAEINNVKPPRINPNTTNLTRDPVGGGVDRPVDTTPRDEASTKQAPKHGVQQMRTGYGIVPPRGSPPEFAPDGTRTQMLASVRPKPSPALGPGIRIYDSIDEMPKNEICIDQVMKNEKLSNEDRLRYAEEMMVRWGLYFANLEKGNNNVE